MTAPMQGISRIDGKYRVLAQLGQGGSADVSLAVARGPSGFNKLVVLKSMKASLRDEPELARMFLNEARLAARLNHPNIVQTNEVFEFEGLPVIVMEYLEGQSFSSVIGRAQGTGKLALPMRLRVISEALSGLHYSHELADFDGSELRLVHRDMSPHNVFITFDGQVKILDFGIAKLAASQHHTATGVIKGKLHYMPPEQISNEGVDRRSDLYAVGVMLWEAAADRRMWLDEHDAVVMNHILNGEIPRLRDVTSVDPELERIVDKALALDQGDRYASALEMQADLDAFIQRTAGSVSMRQIGEVVAELFEETRVRTRRLIESQLARIPTLSAAEYAASAPLELNAGTHSGFTAGSRSDIPRPEPAKTAAAAVAVVALAAVATLVLAGWLLRQRPEAGAGLSPSASVSAPASVRLRITAFPAQARVFIDGEQVPANPYSRDFHHRPGQKVTIRAEADEHRTEVRELVLAGDSDVVLVLERIPTTPASAAPEQVSSVRSASPVRSANPRRRPSKPASDECSPPYTLDAKGVKRFKPQCL